ncbi:MAG: A/G-specific adenine glycosylase [Bacteroidales bacterium]|jgi:A/G-specific adenine glycosylase|nr:A/G-specific adenine glycosylase [Bacteroidales bacterium]MDD4385981.1 A/G-specific adenine glycosylase [Bacteroidales bacterium]MDY0196688.1 A/G-specific adenine glycosylase [Tenuifilaceae bacterium]
MDFKTLLANWYAQNARILPWRETSDPYRIWVSEVILQQTRVAQGMAYYHRFIATFPSIKHLANAHEDQVLKVWQGLGYYTRARNMHAAAKYVQKELNGEFPKIYEEMLKLKGVGEYSAGAIASFAFKQPVPAIDGNVYRIIARVFGVFDSPYTAPGKAAFRKVVIELMNSSAPDEFNQALIDFGALQCVPRSPDCTICPFNGYCYAYSNNIIDALPTKAKKIKTRDRYFTYLLIRFGDYTFISKRNAKDIWMSLYEFPLIETEKPLAAEKLQENDEWKKLFTSSDPTITYISPTIKHLLSHQVIMAQFIVVIINKDTKDLTGRFSKVLTSSIDSYTIPTLIDNFLAAEPAVRYFLNPPKP